MKTIFPGIGIPVIRIRLLRLSCLYNGDLPYWESIIWLLRQPLCRDWILHTFFARICKILKSQVVCSQVNHTPWNLSTLVLKFQTNDRMWTQDDIMKRKLFPLYWPFVWDSLPIRTMNTHELTMISRKGNSTLLALCVGFVTNDQWVLLIKSQDHTPLMISSLLTWTCFHDRV